MISHIFIKLGTNLEKRGNWRQCRSWCSQLGNRRGKRSAENIEKRWWDDDWMDDDWIDDEIDRIEEEIFWSFPKWMRDEFCDNCKNYCRATWRECCDF